MQSRDSKDAIIEAENKYCKPITEKINSSNNINNGFKKVVNLNPILK